MQIFIYIFLASGGGGLARYLIYLANPFNFYFATFFVNSLGSLAIGYIAKNIDDGQLKTIILVGFLGGFTTFSAFSLDIVKLLESNNPAIAFIHIFLTLFLSIAFCYIGYNLLPKILS